MGKMKVLFVFLFILLLTIMFNMFMDFLLKMSLSQSLDNLMNPFWVMEPGEYVILVFVILLTIGQQISPVVIKKIKTKKQTSL
jgi:hypothetical protein